MELFLPRKGNKYHLFSMLMQFSRLMAYDGISSVCNKRDHRFISDFLHYFLIMFLNDKKKIKKDVPLEIYTRTHRFIQEYLQKDNYASIFDIYSNSLGLRKAGDIDLDTLYEKVFGEFFKDNDVLVGLAQMFIAIDLMSGAYETSVVSMTDIILEDLYEEFYNAMSHIITASFLELTNGTERDITHNVRCAVSHFDRGYKDVAKIIIMCSMDYIINNDEHVTYSEVYSSLRSRYVAIRIEEVKSIGMAEHKLRIKREIFALARDIVTQLYKDENFKKSFRDECNRYYVEKINSSKIATK